MAEHALPFARMQPFGEPSGGPQVSPLVENIYRSATPLRPSGGSQSGGMSLGSWILIGLAIIAAIVVVMFVVYVYFSPSKSDPVGGAGAGVGFGQRSRMRGSARRTEEEPDDYEGGETVNPGKDSKEKPPSSGYQFRAPIGGGSVEFQPQQKRLGEARIITAMPEEQHRSSYVDQEVPPQHALGRAKKVRFVEEEDESAGRSVEPVEKKLLARKSEGRTLSGSFMAQQSPSTARASKALVMPQ